MHVKFGLWLRRRTSRCLDEDDIGMILMLALGVRDLAEQIVQWCQNKR